MVLNNVVTRFVVQYSLDGEQWNAPMTLHIDQDQIPDDPTHRRIASHETLARYAQNAAVGQVFRLKNYWAKIIATYGSPSAPRQNPRRSLQQQVENRQITHLIHFTPQSNVESIKQHGLLPRTELERRTDIEYTPLDQWRNDSGGTCLSIMFPNYRMLYCKRQTLGCLEWAFLLISPAVIWDLNCVFYYQNASSRVFRGVNLDCLKTAGAFQRLFAEPAGDSRQVRGLPTFYTTHPEAEVQVLDTIPSRYILEIIDSNHPDYKRYLAPRSDYQYWTSY